jgi:hypothetical protein
MAQGGPEQTNDGRRTALERVNELADRFSRFESKARVVRSLAALGATVSKYDRAAGATIFRQAAAGLRGSGLDTEEYEQLRTSLLISVASVNADLEEQLRRETLSEAADPVRSADTALHSAQAFIKDNPARAADIATSVLDALPSMDSDQSSHFMDFLLDLRERDKSQADRVFRAALARFRTGPGADWTPLQSLGNYAFGPPGERYTNSSEIDGLQVFDWSARRDGASDETTSAYLKAIAAALSVSTGDSQNQRLRSILARQLQPYALRLAPELAPAFGSALQDDPNMDIAKLFKATPFEEYFVKMAKSADQHARTQALVFECRGHWDKGRFDQARDTAARVEDQALRVRLHAFIDFAQAAAALKEGRLQIASTMAGELRRAMHRSLLYLGIASAYLKKHDTPAAQRMLNLAWHSASEAESMTRPYLLVAIAAMQASADPEAALSTLAEGIRAFNEWIDTQSPPARRRKMRIMPISGGFLEPIHTDDGRHYASAALQMDGLGWLGLRSALRQFGSLDMDRLEAITAELREEELLTEAQIETCELRLRRAKFEARNPKPSSHR